MSTGTTNRVSRRDHRLFASGLVAGALLLGAAQYAINQFKPDQPPFEIPEEGLLYRRSHLDGTGEIERVWRNADLTGDETLDMIVLENGGAKIIPGRHTVKKDSPIPDYLDHDNEILLAKLEEALGSQIPSIRPWNSSPPDIIVQGKNGSYVYRAVEEENLEFTYPKGFNYRFTEELPYNDPSWASSLEGYDFTGTGWPDELELKEDRIVLYQISTVVDATTMPPQIKKTPDGYLFEFGDASSYSARRHDQIANSREAYGMLVRDYKLPDKGLVRILPQEGDPLILVHGGESIRVYKNQPL